MRIKYFIGILLASILLCAALIPLGLNPGHPAKAGVSAIMYFALTYFFFRKAKSAREEWITVLLIFLPPGGFYIPIHIMDFDDTSVSFPSSMSAFVGIAIAVIAYFVKKQARWLILILVISYSIWIYFWGYAFWLHKINFGTFTGKVSFKQPAPLTGIDQYKRVFSNDNLRNKIILLDFWHTACGVCFQEFPILQETYTRYKTDSNVVIFAVNTRNKRDTAGQAFAVLSRLNYDFPILLPSDSLDKFFNLEVYPTTFVINKEGTVVFKGDIERASKVLEKLSAQ